MFASHLLRHPLKDVIPTFVLMPFVKSGKGKLQRGFRLHALADVLERGRWDAEDEPGYRIDMIQTVMGAFIALCQLKDLIVRRVDFLTLPDTVGYP